MCPVELAWNQDEIPALLLLPIATRLEGQSLAELRKQRRAWTVRELDVDDSEKLARSLQEVTRTEWVSKDTARDLGFWSDTEPDDNPPVDDMR
jgi:hypothetical protein